MPVHGDSGGPVFIWEKTTAKPVAMLVGTSRSKYTSYAIPLHSFASILEEEGFKLGW